MSGNFADNLFIVTGAGGFLGRRLVKELFRRKALVAANSLENWDDVKWYNQNGEDNVLCTVGSFQEKASRIARFINNNPRPKTIFFHMAGMSHAGECEIMPEAAFAANVNTTFQVLCFCKDNGVTDLIYPSTCRVYDDSSEVPLNERAPVSPQNYYAITKLTAEELIKQYCKAYPLKGVIARFSNIYGPGSHPDTVINTILEQIKTGRDVRVRDIGPVCDFIHLEDAIEGLLRLMRLEHETACEIINVSSGYGVSIGKLIEMAYSASGEQSPDLSAVRSRSISKSHLVLDNNKLFTLTGWRPKISLSAGLKRAFKMKSE